MAIMAVVDWINDRGELIGLLITLAGAILQLRPRNALVRAVGLAALVVGGAMLMFVLTPWEMIAEPRLRLAHAPPIVEVVEPTERIHLVQGKIGGLVNPRRFKLVLYAHTNRWYVQPFTSQPYADIHTNGVFSTEAHEGNRYAALVVRPGYVPASPLDALPVIGGDVIAVLYFDQNRR